MSEIFQDMRSLRAETQACRAEANLGLRLQRQIRLAAALDLACAALPPNISAQNDLDPKTIQLLKDQLKVIPPPIDARTPEILRDLAKSLDGSLWTDDLVMQLQAEFDRLTAQVADMRTRRQQSQLALQELEGSLDVFRTYANLMTALTGQLPQEEAQ